MRSFFATLCCFGATVSLVACVAGRHPSVRPAPAADEAATIARIYYWRARPGRFDEYSRYVADVAAPIDHEAQRVGAFLSVTTYVTRDSASPWTHMRVFLLRDTTQLAGLSAALDAAGIRVEPDSTKRHDRSAYAATLRDRVGDATTRILR